MAGAGSAGGGLVPPESGLSFPDGGPLTSEGGLASPETRFVSPDGGAWVGPPPHLPALGPELLVALDVDGTIITHEGECYPEVFEAIRRVVDSGAHVVIATGRGPESTGPVLEMLGLTSGFAVSSNGAITLRVDAGEPGGYELLNVITFPPEATLRRLRELVPSALFMVEDGNAERWVTQPFPSGEVLGEPQVISFEEICQLAASRVTLRAPDLESADVHALLADAGLHGVSYSVGWTAWVDIAPEGVSKATALDRIREHLGISPFATVAVGDGHNDHEMLHWAGWSVAMGQAWNETKLHANAVAPHVDERGLAAVLNALVA
ncbi:MAG: HAD hydrolase family protein [bacterium]|nr:HAD hydrolase family protein [bacterium]